MFLFRIGLPSILSLSRIVLLPVLFLLLYSGNSQLFLIFYILIGSTDFWDGYLARKLHLVSSLGKVLDSIADLFFYISSAYFLYFLFPEIILANKVYLIVFFSLLGLSFLISGVLFGKPVMMHTRLLRLNGVLVCLVVITHIRQFFQLADFFLKRISLEGKFVYNKRVGLMQNRREFEWLHYLITLERPLWA